MRLSVVDIRTGQAKDIEVSEEEGETLVANQFEAYVRDTIAKIGAASGIHPKRAAEIVAKLGDELLVKVTEIYGKDSETPKRQYGHYV